jgi:hypothetical protein
MTTLTLPITKVDDTDVGEVAAVTAVAALVALPGGLYKIAAMGQPLLWKIGAVDPTVATGSYLGADDQELIRIPSPIDPATDVDLRFILAANSTADGEINIAVVELYDVPGIDARPYSTPVDP